jgi:hypothetical protein
MRFVYPEFLWGLLTLAVPIIIHLFNFRRYKTLYFSSLTFLQQIDQETKSTQRLKHLLVLIIRCLALAAMVIAFANPYIPVSDANGGGGKPVLAIYLDNSFSMTAKGTEGELLSEAREMARKFIKDATLDTRILLNTNELNGIEQRLLTKVEALEYLDKIQPSSIVRQIDDVINWQRAFIDKQHQTQQRIGSRQYVIFSDFQKVSSNFSKLKKDEQAFYYPVQLRAQEAANLYIDTVWFTSPIQRIGENNELNIRIVNAGTQDMSNVEVHLDVGGIQRDVFMDLPANEKVTTTVNYTEKTPGIKKGKLSVNDKQLFWDDDYFFSYQVKDRTKILLVNGENSSPAVAKVYALEPYYSVNTISQSGLSQDNIRQVDLVFLNGINELSSSTVDQLKSFTTSGGSLAIFPGSQCETGSLNSLLGQINLPSLGKLITTGTRIEKLIFDDPFFSGMFEKQKENVNLPTVNKAYSSSQQNTNGSFELIRMQNGMSLLSRSGGSYNAFLFGSSLESGFGNITADALFPSMILRIAEMSQRKTPIALTIGKDSYFPLYDQPDTDKPVHIQNGKIDFIPQTKTMGSMKYLSLSGNEALELLAAGTYNILAEETLGVLSLNFDRKESDHTVLQKSEIIAGLEQYCKNVSYNEIKEGQSLTKIDIEKPFEYWKTFVILALICVMAEMAVLKLWK